MHIPWDVVAKVGSVLGTLAGLVGWDTWRKRAATALAKVEHAGVDAVRHLVDELKQKIILEHPVSWWEERFEKLLGLAGFDLKKLEAELRTKGLAAARRWLHDLVAKHNAGGELDHLRTVLKDFQEAEATSARVGGKGKPKPST